MVDSAEETLIPSPGSPESTGVPNKIEELKRKIKAAGDSMIPLAEKSKDGKPLHLLVTHREFDPYPKDMEMYTRYKKPDGSYAEPIRGVCWTTIFEEQPNGEKAPIGCYDWSIRGENFSDRYALGSGSASLSWEDRRAIESSNPGLAKADKLWRHRAASFIVEPDYQEHGIGTFLLSASIAAMDAFDIREFKPTALLVDSTKVWVRAGLIPREDTQLDKLIDDPKARPIYYPKGRFDVKSALTKPMVQASISQFV